MADSDAPVRHAVTTEGRRPDAGLARDLGDLAREMLADQSEDAVLNRIAQAAVTEVDGASYAGISEISGGTVRTRAGTDVLVSAVDELQHAIGQGPCLHSLREQRTVKADDLRDEPRWPQFAQAALEAGVRSVLAVQLFVEGDNLGALNLYSAQAFAFDSADESAALMLATHAAVGLKTHRNEVNLRLALESRDVIGQAKGILMERYKVNAASAFDLLVTASQRTHRKLREVADELCATGELTLRR